MEISGPQMKLLEAVSFYGTQSKHFFNEKVKGDFPTVASNSTFNVSMSDAEKDEYGRKV
jgi:endonuclease YncB( thermonuclease family)